MKTTPILGALAVAVLLSAPALAQDKMAPNAMSNMKMENNTAGTPATAADTAKLTANGYLRSSKLVGADVYNSQDTSIGTVDDLLIGTEHGKAAEAVLSVGGFLGIGDKLVEVPFSKLKLNKQGHLVLSGATKDSLTKLPTYQYAK